MLLSTAAASSLVPNIPLLATLTPVLLESGRQEGCPISFRLWLGFGISTVLMELAASALWFQQWPPPAG